MLKGRNLNRTTKTFPYLYKNTSTVHSCRFTKAKAIDAYRKYEISVVGFLLLALLLFPLKGLGCFPPLSVPKEERGVQAQQILLTHRGKDGRDERGAEASTSSVLCKSSRCKLYIRTGKYLSCLPPRVTLCSFRVRAAHCTGGHNKSPGWRRTHKSRQFSPPDGKGAKSNSRYPLAPLNLQRRCRHPLSPSLKESQRKKAFCIAGG